MLIINNGFFMSSVSPCTVMPANLSDALELTSVVNKSFEGSFHLNTIAYNEEVKKLIPERLANPQRYTIYKCVTDENKIAGTATGIWKGYFETKGVVLPEVGTLAVLPEHRGKKIADRLIAAVEEGAKERNLPGVTLCHSGGFDIVHRIIDSRVMGLHHFYQKLGYMPLEVNGRLQHNVTPQKPKFTVEGNPGGRSLVVWMAKLFSEDRDPVYFAGKTPKSS